MPMYYNKNIQSIFHFPTLDLGMKTLTIILQPTRKHPSTTQTTNLIHKIKNINYFLLNKKSAQ